MDAVKLVRQADKLKVFQKGTVAHLAAQSVAEYAWNAALDAAAKEMRPSLPYPFNRLEAHDLINALKVPT